VITEALCVMPPGENSVLIPLNIPSFVYDLVKTRLSESQAEGEQLSQS